MVVFRAAPELVHSGWFVVSLLTELAVVLVLRTRGPMWASPPAPLLLWTTVAVAVAAVLLPASGTLAALFGFVPLPWALQAALAAIVAGYIVATEATKRWFWRVPRPGA
jgi:Mg2+-importing ATPase